VLHPILAGLAAPCDALGGVDGPSKGWSRSKRRGQAGATQSVVGPQWCANREGPLTPRTTPARPEPFAGKPRHPLLGRALQQLHGRWHFPVTSPPPPSKVASPATRQSQASAAAPQPSHCSSPTSLLPPHQASSPGACPPRRSRGNSAPTSGKPRCPVAGDASAHENKTGPTIPLPPDLTSFPAMPLPFSSRLSGTLNASDDRASVAPWHTT